MRALVVTVSNRAAAGVYEDRSGPVLAELLRAAGAAAGVPAAMLSRGVAGVAGRTLVVNLPGSTGGVRDGMAVLAPVLGHAVSQIHGGDHVRAAAQRLPAPAWRPGQDQGMMGLWDACVAGRLPSPRLTCSESRLSSARYG